jgi:hypothetical protein
MGYLLKTLAYFYSQVVFFLLLSFESSLYIFYNSLYPLSDISFANIITLLILSFIEEKS